MTTLSTLDRARLAWWAIGALLAGALVFVIYTFIGTFVFAIFIYYATRPLYRRLKRRIRPPSLAAIVALFVIALPVLALVSYTVSIGLQELANALQHYEIADTESFGSFEAIIQPYIDVSTIFQHDPQQLLTRTDVTGVAGQTLDSALQYAGFVGNALLHLFVMIGMAFYLLRDDQKLSRWFANRFGDDRGVLKSYVKSVDRDFTNIFFGNILNALLTGIIGALSYNILDLFAPPGMGLPYATLLGLLTGAASLIPVVGMKLVYFPVSAYLLGQSTLGEAGVGALWFAGVFFAVSFIIVDTIPDLVLRPFVSGRNLHVGMVMFAYIFGPLLFGWYGIFLGPMILVLIVHFGKIVLPELLAGKPIQPWAVDPAHLIARRSGRKIRPPVGIGDDETADAEDEPISRDVAGSATDSPLER